jgi:predicted amidophosphoribosyltransferase
MTLTPEMARAGVTPQLLSSTHRFICPRCGKEFSLFQSRAIACRACPQANRNCKFVRCVHCDYEYPLNGFVVNTKEKEKFLANYMNGVVDNYHKSFGYYRR